jgi:hypothetical protein
LQPKYTQEVGGDGGTVCEDKCADGAYITHWKLRTGSLVDSIMGLCTDGKWLKNCGGNGGNPWEGDADDHSLPERCGTGLLNRASAMLLLVAAAAPRSQAGLGARSVGGCRSGSMIDKFIDQGGNGGNEATLDCGAGYRIGGYKTGADNVLFKLSLYCVPSATVVQGANARSVW